MLGPREVQPFQNKNKNPRVPKLAPRTNMIPVFVPDGRGRDSYMAFAVNNVGDGEKPPNPCPKRELNALEKRQLRLQSKSMSRLSRPYVVLFAYQHAN